MWICIKRLLIILICSTCLNAEYCEIEKKHCRHHKHIGCDKNNFPQSRTWSDFHLVEMTPQLRGELLDILNEYRNRIALGKIPGFPTATNLQILSWKWEFEFLMENAVKRADHGRFYCVGTSEYNHPYENQYLATGNYTVMEFLEKAMKKFMKTKMTDPEDTKFSSFYSASVNKIGCAYGNYIKENKRRHVLKCLSNEWAFNSLSDAYDEGDSCSDCPDDGGCDTFYAGLCAISPPGPPGIRGPPGPQGPPASDYYDECC